LKPTASDEPGAVHNRRLDAVESGISVFEDQLMANIVLPGGETVGAFMRPRIAKAYRIGHASEMLPMLTPPQNEQRMSQ
jgi:hypothetical protein